MDLNTVKMKKNNSKPIPWYYRGINIMLWTSPFLDLHIFFPLAVLFAWPRNLYLRQAAYSSLFIQIGVFCFFYPLKLISFAKADFDSILASLSAGLVVLLFPLLILFSIYLYFSQRRYFHKKKWKGKITKKRYLLPSLFITLSIAWFYTDKNGTIAKFATLTFLSDLVLYFLLSSFAGIQSLGNHRIHRIFRRLWLSLELQKKRIITNPIKWARYATRREALLPGWGHIFLRDYWKGFPILFIFLLLLLFFGTFLAGFVDPVFGINFMGSFGLKFGTGDKKYYEYVKYPLYLFFIGLLVLLWFYSRYSIKKLLFGNTQKGLATGFLNNLHFSILLHFILLTVLFLIPATLRREEKPRKKMKPPTPRFYTIDTEIPENVKKLDGGVINGFQEKKKQGEIIPDKKNKKDLGKVAGKTSQRKGKQIPPTYSNYISAKMRAPGFFSDYWARAPYPYSCVVSYTITADGDIINIRIVENSSYPEQDNLTIELIESMAPLMPFPGTKESITVTELFWNGPVDPAGMPSPLQKEMVTMFDGRYLEEEE